MPFGSMFSGRRKGTKSIFAQKEEKDTKLPEPNKQEDITEESKDKGKKKEEEDEHAENDDKGIAKRVGRDPNADTKESGTAEKGQKQVEDNVAKVRPMTRTEIVGKSFDLFWDGMLNYTFVPRSYKEVSRWIPNATALMEIMLESSIHVGQSSWIRKHEQHYNEYAVAVGISIIYYIQILRAKSAATELTGHENSLLNRFTKLHPEEGINIPAPFMPYLSTIVATKMDDRKYRWVIPDYKLTGGSIGFTVPRTPAGNEFSLHEGLDFIRPQVPQMLAMLSTFGKMTRAQLAPRVRDGVYTPLALTDDTQIFWFDGAAAGTTLNYADATGNVTAAHMQLETCGMNYPVRFHNDNADYARRYMANAGFYGQDKIDVTLNHGQTTGYTWAGKDLTSLDSFLFMDKSKNIRWFDYIKGQLKIFSKHFDEQFNLSQVPKVGGLESSIILHIRTSQEVDATNHRHMYASPATLNHGATDTRNFSFYPEKFRDLTAHAETSRVGILRKEELQALTFATSSLPPIHGINKTRTHEGKFFEHSGDEFISQEIGDVSSTGEGVIELFAGWRTDVFKEMYREEPVGRK